MRALGIDLGRSKTGVAYTEGIAPTPFTTLRHKSQQELLQKLKKVIEENNVDTIIIGTTEGSQEKFYSSFAKKLQNIFPKIKVRLQDETLSTRHALARMIKLQIPKKKRRKKEDEYAAVRILEEYLEI